MVVMVPIAISFIMTLFVLYTFLIRYKIHLIVLDSDVDAHKCLHTDYIKTKQSNSCTKS